MFIYLLLALTGLFFVAGIVALIFYFRGYRFFKSREHQETEDGLHKAFGKDTRWGFADGANNESRGHSAHSHSSDSSGSHSGGSDSGGGDGGGGGD